MKGRSGRHGTSTSVAWIESITSCGIHLRARDRKYFMSYARYPWFRGATKRAIHRVILHQDELLRWPDLDVDLSLESVEHPERFPLVASTTALDRELGVSRRRRSSQRRKASG